MSSLTPPYPRTAVELARAAARRGRSDRGAAPAPGPAALPTGAREREPAAARQSLYAHLLSAEGLTALDALRDAGEALQPAVKLSDLKKRMMLANLSREDADIDVPPRMHAQGSYAVGALVRAAQGVDVDTSLVTSAETLGARIRRAREGRGLSQVKLAEEAGVGRRFVSELENGKSSLEFDKVLQVAAAAGVELMARNRP